MLFKFFSYISVLFVFGQVQSQPNDCNKISFYPADHIQNPSLEKVGAFCWGYLGSKEEFPLTGDMELVIPHWRVPITNYGTVGYFGFCNNFDPLTNGSRGGHPIVPRPLPDGSGVIGLLSGRSPGGSTISDSISPKHYISTNLKRILKKDSLYRLDFALGFGIPDTISNGLFLSGSPVKYTLFGLTDSTNIPFERPASPGLLGCLSEHFPKWIALESVVISGSPGTWQRAIIEFVAPSNIESIAIGQACDNSDVPYQPRNPGEGNIDFYFIDDLRFFQASAPKPQISKIAGSTCEGESTTLRLQSNNFYIGSAFQWYRDNIVLPENEVSLTVSNTTYGPGWYKMRVQNDSVCMMSDSIYLSWATKITNPFVGNRDTIVCKGEPVVLQVNAGPDATYVWNTGSTDSAITVTETGTYAVKVSNACNTLNSVKYVTYKDCPPDVFVPTAFTPNGDGLNDLFRVSATGRFKTFSLTVYNRFGQRIFYSNDPAKGWDGTVKSGKQSTGLYIWMLQYTDGSDKTFSQKGTLTLIR